MTDKVLKISASSKRQTLSRRCPHGLLYFCDGRVNRTEMKERMLMKKKPCEYLKRGKYTNKACRID